MKLAWAAAVAAEQVRDLVERGVGDFHFYTMNRADLAFAVSVKRREARDFPGAARIAKDAGKLPASMERFIDKLMNNKVHWRERLRRFAMLHSKNTISWNRLQRRMLPFGYCMPSRYSRSMGLIVNSIDTSGSVDQFQLDAFGSEINSIKLMARPKQMTNIYCDARVQKVDTYDEYQVPEFKMPGRGGTDFRPPFEYVKKNDLKPACFIYLTTAKARSRRSRHPTLSCGS